MRPIPLGSGLCVALFLAGSGCGPACPQQLHTDAARVLAEHAERGAKLLTLRAQATVDQRGPEGRVRGEVMMFLERPDHVRFDAITQFGPALILTSDGSRFMLSDFKENRFLSGPACARNIARMIGIALAGDAVVNVLFGDTPRLVGRSSIQCSQRGGYQLELRNAKGEHQEIELAVHDDDFEKPPEQQRLRLVRSEMRDARDRPVWRVSYDDHRAVEGGAVLPFRVHVEDLKRDADAVLRFEDIRVNVSIPSGAFSQAPRSGLRIEDVTCN